MTATDTGATPSDGGWRLFRGDGAPRRVGFPQAPPWRRFSSSHEETARPTPYLIGLGTFLFLLVLLAALVAFGGGREHS